MAFCAHGQHLVTIILLIVFKVWLSLAGEPQLRKQGF